MKTYFAVIKFNFYKIFTKSLI